MERNLNELKVKSINELIIPNQLQGYVRLIEMLINDTLDDSSISEIFKLIENHSIRPDFIKYLLYVTSCVLPHKSSSLSNIGEMMQKQKIINTFTNFDDFDKKYETQRIIHSLVWDKIDEFISEIEKETFDINQKFNAAKVDGVPPNECTLINIACKYGSENCFKLLKLKGATISDQTSIYAIKGGNKNIILGLYNDTNFKITDRHLTAALKYHHNDIFDWLLETKGSIGDLNVAECFYFFNIKGLIFLLENGFNINKEYDFHQ